MAYNTRPYGTSALPHLISEFYDVDRRIKKCKVKISFANTFPEASKIAKRIDKLTEELNIISAHICADEMVY